MSLEAPTTVCWPKAVVVRVLRDFTTVVESAKAVSADAVGRVHPRECESLGLWQMADSWRLSNRLADARFHLSAPVEDDPVDWLEPEVADVVKWEDWHRDSPAPQDAGRVDGAVLNDSGQVCVPRATFILLMRDLEMMVVSLDHVHSFTWDLGSSESAAACADFLREWRVFELLARDAAVLAAAFGDDIDEVLDDLPVWSSDFPEPQLARFASERET